MSNNSINKEDDFYQGSNDNEESKDSPFSEYDLTSSPNDFNVKTLFDFIKSGIVKIPGFQRNYVWDIKRASKLIESIIIGIPIPQIFLYQQGKNDFIVIDGQQRYMTIYYFMLKRFPKKEKRQELRQIFKENKEGIPDQILNDNRYFTDFNLRLPENLPDEPNPLNKKNYLSLDEDSKTTFDLRTIRNVIIKENLQNNEHSAMYEIFHRLNSGGVNLKPQEIRTSLFHSDFYKMLEKLNQSLAWRQITPSPIPDLHMKDIEIILRSFAILMEREAYKPSMTKFLNKFSSDAKQFDSELIVYLEKLFMKFTETYRSFDKQVFYTSNNRFSITIFESIFYFSCIEAFNERTFNIKETTLEKITALKEDPEYTSAILDNTAGTKSINIRLDKAVELL